MVFNGVPFLIFFPLVVLAYYITPQKYRWVLLLVASYVFYGFWKVEYLGLIVISTVVDYFVAQFLDVSGHEMKRRIALALSLTTNLGLLFFFKYSNWFIEDVIYPVGLVGEGAVNYWQTSWDFLLPVGISFYTFQTMSYSIDVYFRRAKAETNIFKLGLFVSFFPQLVAGPIERFNRLHHQLFEGHSLQYATIKHGLRLMLYGFFIKMCVADNISPLVDQIFENSEVASSLQLFIGMLLFGTQIFADFNGYSLIAIGTAKVLGIHLIDNFNSPYTASSIRSFWNRWHISLSTWFRDYVFIPMGGSRMGNLKLTVNILVVFCVSGAWHGANWTFIVWGGLHGLAYLVERFASNSVKKNPSTSVLGWVWTMTIVFVAWIFFRSPDISHASAYLTRMIAMESSNITLEWNSIIVSFLGLFYLSDHLFSHGNFHGWVETKSPIVRWFVYSFLLYSILAHAGTVNHPFIYFQF